MAGTKFAQLREKITKEGGTMLAGTWPMLLGKPPMPRICLNGLFLLGHYMRS